MNRHIKKVEKKTKNAFSRVHEDMMLMRREIAYLREKNAIFEKNMLYLKRFLRQDLNNMKEYIFDIDKRVLHSSACKTGQNVDPRAKVYIGSEDDLKDVGYYRCPCVGVDK